MRMTTLSQCAAVSLRFGRQVCGVALVLIAFSGPAHAKKKPEIDSASLKATLTLLGGGILLVVDRFWRRRKR